MSIVKAISKCVFIKEVKVEKKEKEKKSEQMLKSPKNPEISNTARLLKLSLLFSHIFSLPLLCFFITIFFYIYIITALRMARPLYDDLQRQTHGNSLLLTLLSIFVLPWPTFAFCIIAPLFFSRSIGVATDVGSLTAGLDGHVVRLWIGRKGLQKNMGKSSQSFQGTLTFSLYIV
jgi:hypothetical protein